MDEVKKDKSYSAKSFLENLPSPPRAGVEGMPLSDVDVEIKTLLSLAESALLSFDLQHALDLFEKALLLRPFSPSLLLRQGRALLSYGQNKGKEKTLLIVCKKCKQALQLSPEDPSALHLWGRALYHLGKAFKEKHYFQSSDLRLTQAMAKIDFTSSSEKSDLFWDIARVKYVLAGYSEEPMDWQQSIHFFEKSKQLISTRPSIFWDEYGICCLDLFDCTNDIKLLVDAIQHFKFSLTLGSPSHLPGWKHLALALRKLYEQTHDEEHFSQASCCYTAAQHLFPHDASLLLDHASLQLESLRLFYEEKKALCALDCCQRAALLDSDEKMLYTLWAQTLSLYGEKTEKLDLILEGQNKIEEIEQRLGSDPAISLGYGRCLIHLARYFDDVDMYYLAIEKFQASLSLDRTLSAHWHAMGIGYFEIGTHLGDSESLEKGVKFLQKAVELTPRFSEYRIDLGLCMARLGEYKACQLWLQRAIEQFEASLHLQKNAYYVHPNWLYHYAKTLDLYGDFHDEESYYAKAIELLAHVLIVNPSFAGAHHQMGLSFCHLAQLTQHSDHFHKALQHLKVAAKQDDSNDIILVDQAITLIHIALASYDSAERQIFFSDAEVKLLLAAKSGNLLSYYQLACLYSLEGKTAQAFHFLEKAEKYGALPPVEEIIDDDWLDELKSSSEWHHFLLRIEKGR